MTNGTQKEDKSERASDTLLRPVMGCVKCGTDYYACNSTISSPISSRISAAMAQPSTSSAVEELFDPFALLSEKGIASNLSKQPVDIAESRDPPSYSDLLYSTGSATFDVEATEIKDFDQFDPFGIGVTATAQQHYGDDSSTQSPNPPPELFRLTRSGGVSHVSSSVSDSANRQTGVPLPPKLMVRLIIHEEVSSVALGKADSQGASEVTIEGTVKVRSACIVGAVPILFLHTHILCYVGEIRLKYNHPTHSKIRHSH